MKKEQMVEKGSREYYERQVAMGRSTLLVVLCLTAANLLLLISNTNFYLLFSASVPYYLTSLARSFDLAEFGGVNHVYTWMALGVSTLILGLFLVCWLLSRKTPQWLTVGLALLCWFIFGGFTDSILDLVMHGWVIYELLVGIRAARRLQSDV